MTRPPSGFDLPWRVQWEVPPGGDPAVAEAIREAGPLAMTADSEEAGDLLCLALPWPGASVTWGWEGWREGTGAWPRPFPLGVSRVELPVEDAREAERGRETLEGSFLPAGVLPAFRFLPRPGAEGELLPLLLLAARAGWGVTLPPLPGEEAGSLGPLCLPPGEAGALRGAASPFAPGRLVVHDFTLSMTLGLPVPEVAGCEAGDALAFVDREGRVWPCRSLLVPLGSLPGDSFESLWASPARAALRERVTALPAPCAACPDLPACRGGCRGHAFHASGGFLAADPACPRGGSRGEAGP